jgi:hypothetical protein
MCVDDMVEHLKGKDEEEWEDDDDEGDDEEEWDDDDEDTLSFYN